MLDAADHHNMAGPGPRPPVRWQLVAAVIGVVIAGALSAVLVPNWWQSHVEADKNTAAGTSGALSYYPSVAFMADRLNCRQTLREAPVTPGIRSAGTCTLAATPGGAGTSAKGPGNVQIEMRVGDTAAAATAWLAAARQDPNDSAGAIGGNWAIKIRGTHDRTTINRILARLP